MFKLHSDVEGVPLVEHPNSRRCIQM